jgi:AcrR family transcriptional regulator
VLSNDNEKRPGKNRHRPLPSVPQSDKPIDGRRARGLRSRQAVIDAYLDLLRETREIPTSEQVAQRAGLSPRALFGHFPDRETLAISAFDHVLSLRRATDATPMLGASRAERIKFQVEIRARSCERWLPLWRVVLTGQFSIPGITSRIDMVRELLRRRLTSLYEPELSLLGKAERTATLAALETLTGFEGWERMRVQHKMSYDDACKGWIRAVDRLLPPTPVTKR